MLEKSTFEETLKKSEKLGRQMANIERSIYIGLAIGNIITFAMIAIAIGFNL